MRPTDDTQGTAREQYRVVTRRCYDCADTVRVGCGCRERGGDDDTTTGERP